MSAVGELALWAALVCAAWGVASGVLAWRRRGAGFAESAARAAVACAVLLVIALAGLAAMLLAPDMGYAYAASSTSAALPRAYRLAALLSRAAGSVLAFAALTAVIASLAPRSVRALPRASVASATILFAAVALDLAIGSPFARASVAAADGAGLDPAWHLPWTIIARVALIVFAVAIAIAKVRAFAGASWRRVSYAPAALGAIALVCAARRALAGPPWGAPEWTALVVWIATVAFAQPWKRPARALALASAVAAAVALAGTWMSVARPLLLADGVPLTARDPLGATWTFVSDGRSIYTQLDRRVLALFIETGLRAGARPEWRIYVDAFGDTRAESPVDAVIAGAGTYTTLGLLAPPGAGSASVRVRWVPFFACWWLAAALYCAATIASARRPEAT